MKIVADYITEKLYDAGAKHIFMITGGMIMFLTDALYRNNKIKYICCHHEQAATMAAEAYGRYTNKLGVAFVTAGPAALNCLNSVVGALVDRSPCIIVAGQSKVSQTNIVGPRQFALQGFNTLPIYTHVTKYAAILNDIKKVRFEIEKAIFTAKQPPFGPVWIECPIDIQGAPFNPDKYEGYIPRTNIIDAIKLEDKVDLVIEHFKKSRRPCILAGQGVRLSESVKLLQTLVEKVNIPVLTSRLGMDITGHDNPFFVGRPGTYGDRAANFTIQNSDLILIIGCRMGIGLVGYGYQDVAKKAFKIMVDVDENELSKPSIKPDLPIKADSYKFLDMLNRRICDFKFENQKWIEQTQHWKNKYPVNLPEYKEEKEGINSYHFINEFSEKAASNSIFVVDTGSCFHVHAQAFKVKLGQRHIITGGLSTMGYSPAANGVAAAANGQEVFCITGDGSFQFNLQELQTIVHNKLPVKIIYFNNNGYLLIRVTQSTFLESRFIGINAETGVSFPDIEKISNAYGIDFIRISNISELDDKLQLLFKSKGPLICEVICPSNQKLMPRVQSIKKEDGSMESMPYDDMFPYLPREEYLENCVFDKI